jgi:hypothetical protein
VGRRRVGHCRSGGWRVVPPGRAAVVAGNGGTEGGGALAVIGAEDALTPASHRGRFSCPSLVMAVVW